MKAQRGHGTILIGAAAALLGCAKPTVSPRPSAVVAPLFEPAPGHVAPPFSCADIHGETVRVPTNRPVTLLVFWATWSVPDFHLIRAIQPLLEMHPTLAIIAVSVDEAEAAQSVRESAATLRVHHPIVHDAGHQIASAYRPPTAPTVFVLDKYGVVRFVHTGFHDGDDLAIDDEVRTLFGQDLCAFEEATAKVPPRYCLHQCERLGREPRCPEREAPCRAACRGQPERRAVGAGR